MGWGLMAGIGRGLSQGAEIMNRGMAEDRQAAREAERERRREEAELRREQSMERRWSAEREDRKNERKEDRELRQSERKEDRELRQSERKEDRAERRREFDMTNSRITEYQNESLALTGRQVSLAEEKDRRGTVESGVDRIDAEYEGTKAATLKFYQGRRAEIQERLADDTGTVSDQEKKILTQQLNSLDSQLSQSLETLEKDYTTLLNKTLDSYGPERVSRTKWEPYRNGLMQFDPTISDYVGQQMQSDLRKHGSAGDTFTPAPVDPSKFKYPKIGTIR